MGSEDLECEDGEYDLACENARLIVENERLREIMRRLKEDTREHYEDWIGYGCDGNDAIRFVGDVSNILRAALQPQPKGKPDAA